MSRGAKTFHPTNIACVTNFVPPGDVARKLPEAGKDTCLFSPNRLSSKNLLGRFCQIQASAHGKHRKDQERIRKVLTPTINRIIVHAFNQERVLASPSLSESRNELSADPLTLDKLLATWIRGFPQQRPWGLP